MTSPDASVSRRGEERGLGTVFGWYTLVGRQQDVYPLTIVAARYGGTYEGGRYLAFPCDPQIIPAGWDGGDCECSDFFHDWQDAPIGRGDTPDAAHADLKQRLRIANDRP